MKLEKDDEESNPCHYCRRKDHCAYPCFVYVSYLHGAIFNPRVVRNLIRE